MNIQEEIIRKKKNASLILRKAEQLLSKIGKRQCPEDLTEVVNKYSLPKKILEEKAITVDLEWINREFKNWLKKQDFSGGELAYNTIDEKGDVFQSVSMAWPNKQMAPEDYFIPLVHPKTKRVCPIPEKGWRFPSNSMKELLAKGEIIFGKDETTQPRRKYLLKKNLYENISSIFRFGGSDDKLQLEMGIKLENPKPVSFAKEILSCFTKNEDYILDSFAGSGTTAHAILELNQEDKQKRKFILVEMMDYAEKITAERVKKVITGYSNKEGTGGGFDYYTLGETLFTEDGNLNESVAVEKIRKYIFYTETQSALKEQTHADNPYFLGLFNNTAYYFHYEAGISTTLNHQFLSTIKTKAEQYIIYSDNCVLTKDYLTKHKISFKKIPRDITQF